RILALSAGDHYVPNQQLFRVVRRSKSRPALALYVLGAAVAEFVSGAFLARRLSFGDIRRLCLEWHPKIECPIFRSRTRVVRGSRGKLASASIRRRDAAAGSQRHSLPRTRHRVVALVSPAARGGLRLRHCHSWCGDSLFGSTWS